MINKYSCEIEGTFFLSDTIFLQFFQALKCSTLLLQKAELHNRRTLDLIMAKCFFYHSRAYELLDRLDATRRCVFFREPEIRERNDIYSVHQAYVYRAYYTRSLI